MLGFTGPKAEAEEIKQRLAAFLRDDLALDLSADKTLITHARTGAARFLGYEITVGHDDRQFTRGKRAVNGGIKVRVPPAVVKAKSAPCLLRGQPARRPRVINHDDYDIVRIFGAEYRGIVQYYLLAGNIRLLHRLRWVMLTSMLKTLASEHHSTASKIADKHNSKIETPHGLRTCFEASVGRDAHRKPLVARFGGIPLRRQKTAVIDDRLLERVTYPRTELVTRLLRNRREPCERTGEVLVHHVGKLAYLARPGSAQPAWDTLMAKRRRKTLVVYAACHDRIHRGQRTATLTA